MMFEANLGQAGPTTAFVGRGPGYATYFDGDGMSLVRGQDIVRMDLRGADRPRISGVRPHEGRANYFIGKPDQWIIDVPLYSGIEYKGVYPGVDLVFYSSTKGDLEYDFTLAPGASASTIGLAFQGIDEMRTDGGDLVLKARWGELRHRRPRIYQMKNGRRSEVAGRFVIRGPLEAGFETEPHDARSTLVIDPVMAYSTFIGGSGADSAWAVAVDSVGSAYVVGDTRSLNFPRTLALSNSSVNGNAYILKLNPSGTGVLYATYFGGSGGASARGVAVDAAGSAYVTGLSYLTDFPATAGAYRSPSLGQTNAFAIKVSPSGSALVYSALVGGPGSTIATGIAIDSSGNAYLSGYTNSVAFPVTSSVDQRSYGGGMQDAFVAKLNLGGSALVYCTYLGGAGNDVANGIAVDAAGQAHIVGYTDSANFPTRSPIYAKAGGQGDAFIAMLTQAGDNLVFSTYLGGSLLDTATAVALDSSGNIYVTGSTGSTNFPVTCDAYQTLNLGLYDAFVAKIAARGTSLVYSTYVGGEGSDQSAGIAVDASGTAYVAGFTYSYHLPLQNPVQSAAHGGQEAFVAAVGPTGTALVWSTYLGGYGADQATGVAADPTGGVYVVGSTLSADFPTTLEAYRAVYAGEDGFLVKLGPPVPSVLAGTPTDAATSSQTFAFTVRDPVGFADIAYVYFLVSAEPAVSQNSCHGFYNRSGNALYLFNDSLSAVLGPLLPGSSGTLQNSQCRVDGSSSSATASGTDLVLNLALGSQGSYASRKNVYLWVVNNESVGTGWVRTSTWSLTAQNQPPTVVSGVPTAAKASPQTFVFTARDPSGFTDIAYVYFLVSGSPTLSQNTCHGFYSRTNNGLYLYNDALTAPVGPLTPSSSGTLQNSQCLVNGMGSSVTASGTDLVLTLALGSQGSYASGKNIYLWVVNNESVGTGWVQTSTWNLTAHNQPPTVVSGVPTAATASPQTFVFTARDPSGFTDIAYVYFLVSGSPTLSQNTCHGFYSRATNGLYLYNDAVTTPLGPLTPGSSGSLQNSQCLVNGIGTSVTASGTDLVLNLTLGSQRTYAGGKNVYLWVVDNESVGTGWVQTSTWNLTAQNQPPTVVSGLPTAATASPQTFVFTTRDPSGFADIAYVYFLVSGSPTPSQNTCHGFYSRATNGLYLYNDALTTPLGPLTPGSSGTLQNSQCLVNGIGSSALASGTDLVLSLDLESQANYVNGRFVYLWVVDNEGLGTGWVQTAAWRLP